MEAIFPSVLGFLIDRTDPQYACRNKVMYGGRGGLKSWGVVDAALIRGAEQFERVLFARETMDSIKESCHFLLEQRIYALGLQNRYEVQQQGILGPEFPGMGRTEMIFAGLRHNVRNIKSLEGVTICVVEEAESVSKDSWETLLPTIRWESKAAGRASEVWVVFNPKFKKDDTYKRWLVNTPPDTVVCKTSWRDAQAAGLFPKVLHDQMEHMKASDHEGYLHVWEGECVQALEGAIYRNEYAAAEKSGRIGEVPYNPMYPVDTYWDLGFGDRNSIWMVQHINGFHNLIDYEESCKHSLDWYVAQLQKRNYVWGKDYLPHDGVDAQLHGKNLVKDVTKSPDMMLRQLGRAVAPIVPKMAITTGINAGRMIFATCRFDRTRCTAGLDALQQYQWGDNAASGQERTKPLHDWASHGADAFRTFAVSAREPEVQREAQRVNYDQMEYSQWG